MASELLKDSFSHQRIIQKQQKHHVKEKRLVDIMEIITLLVTHVLVLTNILRLNTNVLKKLKKNLKTINLRTFLKVTENVLKVNGVHGITVIPQVVLVIGNG